MPTINSNSFLFIFFCILAKQHNAMIVSIWAANESTHSEHVANFIKGKGKATQQQLTFDHSLTSGQELCHHVQINSAPGEYGRIKICVWTIFGFGINWSNLNKENSKLSIKTVYYEIKTAYQVKAKQAKVV